MVVRSRVFPRFLSLFFVLFLVAFTASAQTFSGYTPARIVAPVDNNQTTVLKGNVHPLARAEFDQGAAPASQPMLRMMMVLQRSQEQETALEQLLDQQQDKSSPQYHQWLTPAQLGAEYGPSDQDVATVTQWLAAEGFTAVKVNQGRTVIEFSGDVAGVQNAFKTSIHRYTVNGKSYSANETDPQIPTALTPVVAGIVSLHNFPLHHFSHTVGVFQRDANTGALTRVSGPVSTPDQPGLSADVTKSAAASPLYTFASGSGTDYGLGPYDFATIYNSLPQWNAGTPIDGTGQVIAIVGETDIYPADFVAFRTIFGLPLGTTSGPTGTQYLNIIYNGPNPGVIGDESEANLDTQWSSAVAKGATIDYVASASTLSTQGIDLSLGYIVDNNLAPVLSMSYGGCEASVGSSGDAFFNLIYEQAAAQGITVFTSAGDSGAASCDNDDTQNYATHGLAVSGLTSTPYNVSVGGTDFNIYGVGSTYFNSTNNSANQSSAKSYIPESVWDDSCTNSQLGPFFTGLTTEGICNSATANSEGLLDIIGGGGGKSTVYTTKPSWQAGTGVPADSVRDVPDVSLFASNGFWGAFYIICQHDVFAGGPACNLPNGIFLGIGGTSASSPAFAGIMSMVNQKTGQRQGNANYVFYNLAAQQNPSNCNSATGSGSSCYFNDVTIGTNAVPCLKGTLNCTTNVTTDTYGILSGNATTTGYDLATGLGSVNINNLVNGWGNASFTATTTTLGLTPTSVAHGSGITATVHVTSTSGTPTGNVSINGATLSGSVGAGSLTAGTLTAVFYTLPGGTYNVKAHYGGDGHFAASDSNTVQVTITPANSTTQLVTDYYTNSATTATGPYNLASQTVPYGSQLIYEAVVGPAAGGFGVPTGTVTLKNGSALIDGGNFALNSAGTTADQPVATPPGSYSLTASYGGDASFNASSTSAPVTFIVTKAGTSATLASSVSTLASGASATLTATLTTTSFGAPPTGTVTFYSGTTVVGVATSFKATFSSTTGYVSVAAAGTFASNLFPAGTDSITAVYSGDTNYTGSTSSAVTITTSKTTTTTVVTLNPASVAQGTTSVLTATVSPAGTLGGSVQFTVDGTNVGSPANVIAVTGVATYTLATSSLSIGTHTIAGTFTDTTGNFTNSTAAGVTLTVTASLTPDFSITPASTTETVANGSTTTADVLTLADINGYSGPVVTFSCTSGLPTGAACVFAPTSASSNGGTTSLTITTTKASAVSGGPSAENRSREWFAAAGGASLACLLLLLVPRRRVRWSAMAVLMAFAAASFVIGCGGGSSSSSSSGGGGKATAMLTLTAATSTPAKTVSDTITASLNPLTATGTIQFTVDGASAGSAMTVTNSSATYAATFTTAGAHTVSATYSGDTNNNAATSNTLTLNVPYTSGSVPGTYTVVVTATDGVKTHTANITLIVQ